MEKNLKETGTDYYARHLVDVEQYVEEAFLSDPAQMARVDHLVDLVPQGVRSLLDVGAGYGIFMEQLRAARDIESEGVEVVEERIAWGLKRGHKLIIASAHELPYADRCFDIVASSEVLEHLPWKVYEQSLGELARVAKDWILISVPYDERRNFARCPYCGASANPCYHFRSFAPTDLEGLFPGFRLEMVDTIGEISVITMLKPYLPTPWHAQLVCPSCGYRAEDVGAQTRDRRLSKLKRMIRAFPLPRRPRWLVGLFRRDS